MTLAFHNPSRSFDATRKAVCFFGHDGMFEVRFFVEADAFTKADGAMTSTVSEEKSLAAFDASRDAIHKVALKAYSRGRGNSYTLTASDFR